MSSPTGRYGYNEQQQNKLDWFLDKIYEDFKQHVATGRNLDNEKVEEIAQGRVWTGRQAHSLGLVDQLGFFL
jgi:protease-4